MSDKNESSLYRDQKKAKPKIEEVYSECLEGDTKKAALSFVAYLRENKMAPGWASANSWKCSYKGKGVCYIRTNGNSWSVTLYGDNSKEYNEFVINGNYQDVVWNSRALKKCRRCRVHVCAPNENEETFTGFRMTFFGKEFENVCRGNGDTAYFDPDERIISYIKGAIDVRRLRIENNKI